MKLPRWLAIFNKWVNNPIQRNWAWLLPPWAIVIHRGRKSGREYRTPVVAFRRGNRLVFNVLYGPESDWVRNLLAADGGAVVRRGRTYRLESPRLTSGETLGADEVGPIAQIVHGVSDHVLITRIGPEISGPRARGST